MTLDQDLLALLEHGAAVVRVAKHDKVPLGNAWNTLATTIADVIADWLGQGYNLGILLGHRNLIDVSRKPLPYGCVQGYLRSTGVRTSH